MRRSMRRTKRGTQRVFTITWVGLALLLGQLGLHYRKPNAGPARLHPVVAPAQRIEPAQPIPSRAPLPPKPANVRNG